MSEAVGDPPAAASRWSPRVWFILTAALFFLWVGFLAFLALSTADTTVLSRPQFLVSTLDVIAIVGADDQGKPLPRVTISQVHWPKADPADWVGKPIEVVNLPASTGWRGAGTYILPLIQNDGIFEVAPLPRSPGFVGTVRHINPPRIYLLTPETQAQLEMVPKPN